MSTAPCMRTRGPRRIAPPRARDQPRHLASSPGQNSRDRLGWTRRREGLGVGDSASIGFPGKQRGGIGKRPNRRAGCVQEWKRDQRYLHMEEKLLEGRLGRLVQRECGGGWEQHLQGGPKGKHHALGPGPATRHPALYRQWGRRRENALEIRRAPHVNAQPCPRVGYRPFRSAVRQGSSEHEGVIVCYQNPSSVSQYRDGVQHLRPDHLRPIPAANSGSTSPCWRHPPVPSSGSRRIHKLQEYAHDLRHRRAV